MPGTRGESSPKEQTVKLLLVSDQEMVRDGLSRILEQHEAIDLLGTCRSRDIDIALSLHRPDVILLDCDGSFTQIIKELRASAPDSKVLAWASRPESGLVRQVYALGALGFMLKSESLDRLWQAVLSVSRGQVWMEKRFVAVMLEEEDNKARSGPDTGASDDRLKLASLTRRELEIIQAIGKGYKNKQIADALCISDTTVRHHLSTIFSKLNVSDRLELLIYAQRHGLVDIK